MQSNRDKHEKESLDGQPSVAVFPATEPSVVEPTSSPWATKARMILHHLKKHTGVGMVCAVAYFDP